jgi:HEAT repeat protein
MTMQPPSSRTFLAVLMIFALSVPLFAHNGEYVCPETMRDPPQLTPPEGASTPKGRPMATPGQVGRPGAITPGSLVPRSTTAKPDTVDQVRAISFEAIFNLLRRRLPEPPPQASATLRTRAVAALTKALGDPNEEVRGLAALSLGRMGAFDEAARAVREDLAISAGVGLLGPGLALWAGAPPDSREDLAKTLLPVLLNGDSTAFARALAALSLGLGGPAGSNDLLRGMEAVGEGLNRDVFLFALGLTGHAGARDVLLDHLLPRPADDGPRRALLVHALSRIPGEEVTSDLTRRLSDRSPVVRAAAILSLSDRLDDALGLRDAIRARAKGGPAGTRSAALLALTLAGDRTVLDLAREALRENAARENGTAAVAAFMLGYLRSAVDGPALVEIFCDTGAPADLRRACAVAAGLTKARHGAERMIAMIEEEKDPVVAAFGAIGLALLKKEAALPLLEIALRKQADDRVRRLLVIALGYTGGERAEELLVKAFGDAYRVNREAPVSLYRLNPERAVTETLKRLENPDNPWSRRFAVMALGRILSSEDPVLFEEVLLRSGMSFTTPVERLFQYLGCYE